jgi:hypothetical protein
VGEPDFFTVEEAADRLRIGRTSAYLAAKQYRETGGADGLPVIAIRGSLRVPRRKLEEWAGGSLSEPGAADVVTLPPPIEPTPERRRSAKRPRSNDQDRLPFTD